MPTDTDISSILALFLLTLLALVPSLVNAVYSEELHVRTCSTVDNYTDGSTYLANLQVLLASLVQNTPNTNLFYFNNTVGKGSDRVYGMALCYAYDDLGYCQACVAQAAKEIQQFCPYSKTATVWYWPCRLRYSNQSFFSVLETSYEYSHYQNDNVTEPTEFQDQLDLVVNQLIAQVITIPQLFALNQSQVAANKTVYAFVQCTIDLQSKECGQCLQSYRQSLIKCCAKRDMTVLSGLSCHIVFALHPFYPTSALVLNPPGAQPPLLPPTPDISPTAAGPSYAPAPQKFEIIVARATWLPKILGVSVAIAAVLILAACGIWLWKRQTAAKISETDDEESTAPLDHQAYSSMKCYSEFKVFELNALKLATGNFSDENQLGEGGFGAVYKGLLINGQEVAVKRLSGSSRQGFAELKNEVDLLAKLKHKNLVQLLGCCIQQKERLLCYEFLPNGSLDKFLYATEAIRREELNWQTRYRIIQGISCGLQYLHEESRFKIIHRDLKASNVLLDIDMTPKISDFGIARLFDEDQTHKDTSIVAGTFGYMAPEYVLHGNFSAKSDVYSFGVLLLEIVTGRKIRSFANSSRACSLISYVWLHVEEGKIDELKDPALDSACSEEVIKCIHIGLLCVQEDPDKRPNMATICVMLDNSYTTTIPPLPPSPQPSTLLSAVVPASEQKRY